LRVTDDLLGQPVKCPACATTFTATLDGVTLSPPASPELSRGARAPRPQAREEEPLGPGRSSRRFPDFHEEDAYEDDEPYGDDRPRRRRRRRYLQPHRGTLILVLGILSLVTCQLLGPFAWVMGNNDLTEMRAGRMDPEGEGLTNAGRVCGIISTILMIVFACCFACSIALPEMR
jgi:hypothetical protein